MNGFTVQRIAPAALILAAASLPGTVIGQTVLTPEQLTVRVERMSQSTERTEAAVRQIQQQMTEMAENMNRLGRLVDNRAMLDMIQQVDDLSSEVSELNGAIEEQVFAIEDLKKRQRELYLDIDRRLRDLESRSTAAAPAGSISIPQVDNTASIETPSASVSVEGSLPQNTSEDPAVSPGTTTTASISQSAGGVTQSEEKAAYQAAFDTLKEGRYKKAKTELKTFLDRYPNSSFSGNAQYWLGEAHYVTRNFDQGMVEFEKVLSQYPSSNKVPDAMLKLGYTFYELKRFPQAKATLQLLREKFPKSTASRLAAKRLDRIRKEGH